jgi:hypothetical protein
VLAPGSTPPPTIDALPGRSAHPIAVGGIIGAVTGAGLVGLLHVVPPSAHVSPVRRTISEYALLESAWVFNLALLVLAAGSAAVLAALVGAQIVRPASGAALALLLWSASLPAIVVFPKHNWAVGPSLSGDIHRVAGLVGFLSLPVAALLIGWAWRADPRWRGDAHRSLVLGALCLLCFSPIGYAILSQPVTGIRWWRAVPLGAVERLLAVTEVITVVALGWWAARAARAKP